MTHLLKEPFTELHALQRGEGAALDVRLRANEGDGGANGQAQTNSSTLSLAGEGAATDSLDVLLASAWMAKGSSRSGVVGDKPHHWNPARELASLQSIIRQLPDLSSSLVSREPRTVPRRARQLKGDRALALAQAYEAGASIRQVAEQFNVDPGTVGRLLKRHGVKPRKRRLTKEQVDEAVRLYEQGLSHVTIAESIGASPDGIRYQLHKRGVKMRSPYDWHKL